jgi:hypothetical protein
MSHVMPVPKDSNQAIGRTLEKLVANQRFGKNRIAHQATIVTLAKIAGFAEHITLPVTRGQPVDAGVVQRLVRLLQTKGFLADDALIRDLTQHLTRWTVTRLQGGDADALGIFAP